MGWKKLKEEFGITHHVCVNDGFILIGSQYVSSLASVDMETGEVHENPTFKGFLSKHYPDLEKADPSDIKKIVDGKDVFSADIAVYTYDGGNIIQKFCEKLGWPNITHDGEMMYENHFSADKVQVIKWAKRNAMAEAKFSLTRCKEIEVALAEEKEIYNSASTSVSKLNAEFPDIIIDQEE